MMTTQRALQSAAQISKIYDQVMTRATTELGRLLVVAQPPDLRGLGLLPVLFGHRVLIRLDEELCHHERSVPGVGDLPGIRIKDAGGVRLRG